MPPGELRAGCYYPPDKPNKSKPDYEELKVVDPEGAYVPTRLGCRVAVSGIPEYGPGARGGKGNVVEITRQKLRKDLEPGDRVERAGYPESRQPIVRVVRDGEVVATASYVRVEKGGWLPEEAVSCESF